MIHQSKRKRQISGFVCLTFPMSLYIYWAISDIWMGVTVPHHTQSHTDTSANISLFILPRLHVACACEDTFNTVCMQVKAVLSDCIFCTVT